MEPEFEPFINYESIVCCYFPEKDGGSARKINAACIGVHFVPNNEVYIHAFPESHTKEFLTPGTKFSINFSEDFYEWVMAGIRRKDHSTPIDELEKTRFNELDPVPVLKSSWISIICEVIPMPEIMLEKPKCRRRQEPNIRAKIITKTAHRFPKMHNNRAWYLAIEALILATRIHLYERMSKTYNETVNSYVSIKKKILEWRDMDRFHDGFEVMDNAMLDNGVKAQNLFDLDYI